MSCLEDTDREMSRRRRRGRDQSFPVVFRGYRDGPRKRREGAGNRGSGL